MNSGKCMVCARFVLRSFAACLVGAAGLAGCIEEPANQPAPQTGQPVVNIISPVTALNVQRGQMFTVTYTITATDTSAITALAFVDPDTDSTNGNETVIADSISAAGVGTFDFDTAVVPRGDYNIGIRAINGVGTTTVYARTASGGAVLVRVNGVPLPAINSPASNMEILTGATVNLIFSCNDPENNVAWSLFYDTNQAVDGNETQIPNGSGTGNAIAGGNSQALTWATVGVPTGTYFVGLSCDDDVPGVDPAVVYTNARVTLTDQLSIPTVEVTAPATDVTAFAGDSVTVNFAVSDPNAPGATVRVFVDDDTMFEQDEEEIGLAFGLLPSTTSFTIDGSILNLIPDGNYFIGVAVEQSGQRNVAYAPGELQVIGIGNLTVSAPSTATTVRPGTDVTIIWNTNVPVGQALIDVDLYTSDATGTKGIPVLPDPLAAATDLEVAPNSVLLDTRELASGFYIVEVTLTPVDADDLPTGDPQSTALSGVIRVTTSPDVFWVGSIVIPPSGVEPLAHFEGVVFEGVNFEDNAGSTLMGLPDLQPTGLGNSGGVLIGARFAKPLFSNPNGTGAGEAYLIYNELSEFNRRYALNAVGTRLDPDSDNPNQIAGLRLAGVMFDFGPEDLINDDDPQIDILSEDADGDGRLDLVNEDRDGDGILDPIEDVDQDGNLDVVEDGFLGIDNNSDGIIDDPSARVFSPQHVNGALDAFYSEDRDGDGTLDTVGDNTDGMTTFGLIPDADADGIPEIVIGFEHTDSLAADWRRGAPFNEILPRDFGSMSQENQFERGGFVIVPTSSEGTIQSPFILGRDEDRVIQLDYVGQAFDTFPGAFDVDPADGDNLLGFGGFVAPVANSYTMPATIVDLLSAPANPAFCGANTIQLEFANNLGDGYPAQSAYIITRTDDDGGITQEQIILVASAGGFDRECIELEADETVAVQPNGVLIINPDSQIFNGIVTDLGAALDMRTATGGFVASGASPRLVSGVVGTVGNAVAVNMGLADATGPNACEIGQDGCGETVLAPYYGFANAMIDPDMASPSHPLAYRRTLANPAFRAAALGDQSPACDECGRSVGNRQDILESDTAPAYGGPSTGYHPGTATAPQGARMLGQAVGDRFGASISSSPGVDRRVFVGAPRHDGGLTDRGAVYQFRMESFWTSSDDLAGCNSVDAPKPHQYIVSEIGSERPAGGVGLRRRSLREGLTYVGADDGDQLGAAVLGVEDFNDDVLADIVMGAPGADGKIDATPDAGAVYVVYRIATDIEFSISLDRLELPRSDANRLNGLLVNGDHNGVDGGDRLGEVIASDCDLNDDGVNDVVLGVPLHGVDNAGEVVVLFGGENISSPENGYSIQELVDLGRALRIGGARAGDQAGFNVACNGDFDGDGNDDLVIAAPFATPMYDSNGDDFPDTNGIDLDKDGLNDGLVTDPVSAGLVYVITNVAELSGTVDLGQLGGVVRGFVFVGRKGGDQMGGGFEVKRNTRSRGLSYGGDVNGDGKDDLLVGAMLADPANKINAGEVYMIFGFDQQEAEDIIGN